jgi:tRNA(Ile)-lysidine synthase
MSARSIRHEVLIWSGEKPRTGIQEAAREARYRLLAAWCRAQGCLHLLTAHHREDQAETYLIRRRAGSGIDGLAGMSAVREMAGLRLVRPLLGVTREETAAWCRARSLRWREDATNASDRYARGRVRAGLVPALRAVHPAAERNVVRTAELLRDEAEVLDVVVDTALAGRDRVAVDHLAALPRALARLVVRRLAERATGELCARAAGRLDDILALGDGALDLGDGARAVVDGGVLRCERTPRLRARRT